MGEPARGYTWRAFEAGHTVSTRHGVWSRRRVDPLVQELVAGLASDRPDLRAYPETLVAWARAEARSFGSPNTWRSSSLGTWAQNRRFGPSCRGASPFASAGYGGGRSSE
jgi:hypothetical protein